ncbi:hypothetical protein BC937DRAFT_95113 [Endogone sp. FLAS-F59071]|nr:hypothetical protein BC937DRAFT_95113 [Endogone sp. FLAS-F59071]|eukprot:RUS20478.1 hypothetical protein BC937DRAFT_95113 [Endogone sp. FLAS-F59071]
MLLFEKHPQNIGASIMQPGHTNRGNTNTRCLPSARHQKMGYKLNASINIQSRCLVFARKRYLASASGTSNLRFWTRQHHGNRDAGPAITIIHGYQCAICGLTGRGECISGRVQQCVTSSGPKHRTLVTAVFWLGQIFIACAPFRFSHKRTLQPRADHPFPAQPFNHFQRHTLSETLTPLWQLLPSSLPPFTTINYYYYTMDHIPTELLSAIVAYLPRQTLVYVSLTSRRLFFVTRPHLYTHLRLSHRRHVVNLESSCLADPGLVETLRKHCRQVTFSCRHNEAQWLLTDARFLFAHTRRLERLQFDGFQSLKVEHVIDLASLLPPSVTFLELSYCNLHVDRNMYHRTSSSLPHLPPLASLTTTTSESTDSAASTALPVPNFGSITHLTFVWTDFSSSAISKLLRRLPGLRYVSWQPNHNRVYTANDSALSTLIRHCPEVSNLDVSLQEVREDSVRAAVVRYGTQLRELRIRCGPTNAVLQAIATHATNLESLELFATEIVRCEAEDLLRVLARCPHLRMCRVAGFPFFGKGIPSELVELGWVSYGPGVPVGPVVLEVAMSGRRPASGEFQKTIELGGEGIERIHKVLVETRKDLLMNEEEAVV